MRHHAIILESEVNLIPFIEDHVTLESAAVRELIALMEQHNCFLQKRAAI